MAGQARCFFGNVQLTDGWDFTLQTGVYPSTMLLRSPPHLASLQVRSDLVISHDGRTRIFRDCHVQDPLLDASIDGQDWTLPILDRRWKWAHARISGSYNVKQADETYLREKTPRELAELLLAKLGEVGFDATAMPTDSRPSAEWDDASAIEELDRLCNDFGCEVCIDQNGSNTTYLVKVGDGPNLPPGPALGGQYSLQGKPLPSHIDVICDKTLWESTFTLEPVGLDKDFKFKRYNDLSYIPQQLGGWAHEDPIDFPNVSGEYIDPFDGTTRKCRDLAKAHLYRSFRITGIETAGNWFPGPQINPELVPQSFKDLELQNERAAEIVIDGEKRALSALVYCSCWDEEADGVTSENTPYRHGFNLDTKRGIVTTSQPAFKFEQLPTGLAFVPANVRLVTSYYAGRNGVFDKHVYHSRTVDPAGPASLSFFRKELRHRIIRHFGNTIDNEPALDSELSRYADAQIDRLKITNSTNVTYEEIRNDIPLSGKVKQITYSGGGGRTGTTTVSQGTPINPYVQTNEEKRMPPSLLELLRNTTRR